MQLRYIFFLKKKKKVLLEKKKQLFLFLHWKSDSIFSLNFQ